MLGAKFAGAFITLVAGLGQGAWANSSFSYTNASNTVYEVVIENSKPDTALPPGIYRIDKKSDASVPLLQGKVLGVNRSFNGVLGYTAKRFSADAPHDILTVINGRVTLLNFNTSQKSPSTYVELGGKSKSSVPVIDVVHGTEIDLPVLNDIEDLSFFEGTFFEGDPRIPEGARFYLLSYRTPSPMGSGLTIGFLVDGDLSRSHKPRIIDNRAIVLGYEFMDTKSLKRLVIEGAADAISGAPKKAGLYLFSPLVISKFKNQVLRFKESSIAAGWADQLTRFQNYLTRGNRAEDGTASLAELSMGIPRYNFIDGEESLPNAPLETISEDSVNLIGQTFEPSSGQFKVIRENQHSLKGVRVGRRSLKFLATSSVNSGVVAQTPVDRNLKTGSYLFYQEAQSFEEATATPVPVTPTVKFLGQRDAFLFFSSGVATLLTRNSSHNDIMQTLSVRELGLQPTDRISFVSRKIKVKDQNYQVFFVLRKAERAEKVKVHALIVSEGDQLSLSHTEVLYEGPMMSIKELNLRIVEYQSDLLFDNVSPVRGPAAYMKQDTPAVVVAGKPAKVEEVPQKSTPYARVFARFGGRPQSYLKSLTSEIVIQHYVTFKEFDSMGSTFNATGFYLQNASVKAEANENFVQGWPLLSRREKSSDQTNHILQQKIMPAPERGGTRYPPVRVALIPYTDTLPKKAKKAPVEELKSETEQELAQSKFKIMVSLTPDLSPGGTPSPSGNFYSLEVPFPYKSLAFTQILQGYKNKADEFYILLFFRADEKIKGSIDGVMVAHGTTHWETDGEQETFKATVSNFEKLYKGAVAPGSIKSHLLVDVEGRYYWVDDPQAQKDSTKYRVHNLAKASELVNPRLGQIMNLREPDHLKETELGFITGRYRSGGRWEVLSYYGLMDAVSGLRETIEKSRGKGSRSREKSKDKEKKDSEKEADATAPPAEEKEVEVTTRGQKTEDRPEGRLLEAFDKYLDDMITNPGSRLNSPRILVVEPALKEKIRTAFFYKLAEGDGPFALVNKNLGYYHANAALDDVEIAQELQYITEQRQDRPKVLYFDSDLLKAKDVKTRSFNEPEPEDTGWTARKSRDEEEELSPFAATEVDAKADLLVLLGSDGKAKSLKGYRKLKDPQNKLPLLSIVTPDEWREIRSAHPNEVAAGVLDKFELNYDFLTSSWTVWPPKTEKAPEEIKSLAKVPYKAEEMRVFPTLDRMLQNAASGELAGKQKIIIVPQELKSLVQKLILLRWSTTDSLAGPWNYQNRKLALHKIMGANSNQQDAIQDNFRAMRGASHSKNAILYSDLESIIRIGRPYIKDSHRGFKINDPIRSSKGYLIESSGATADEAQASAEDASDDEDNNSIEEVKSELENLIQQIDDLNSDVDTLRKRHGMLSKDIAMQRSVSQQLDAKEAELQNLKSMRASLDRQIEDAEESQTAPTDGKTKGEAKVSEHSAYPHLMWWIASEGQAVQPRKKAGWDLKTAVDRNLATILVGTEEELQRLESDMAFESKFFNIEDHFEITRLEAPDEQTKFKLVQQLFERPEISSLNIQFKLKNDNGREPRSQLIYHFINRIDQMAYDQKIEKTAAFIRAYIALKNSLAEDLDLRRNRQIDERFIERMFTKVFPMPLNPDILEANDPLNRLRNQEQAARDLQAAGYEGSQDLKRRFFETVLSQTRPTDSSRPIPNSQILYGGTSTGKTFLLRMLFKMLDMVEYSANKANNEAADYMFINVAKLTGEKTSDPDKIWVADVIDQIQDLLAQPKGARASIVFDDFHKAASKDVREKLSQFIAGIFEATNGMYSVRSKDGRRQREIPVQNLNIYMTLNPMSNETIRKQFVKDTHKGAELLKREVLAALTGDGFNPEESFLARWAEIINFDNFPRSAKVPELVKRVRQSAGRGGQLVLVDPLVIDNLIDVFPQAHARELLSPATAALTSLPPTLMRAPLYLVTPRKEPIGTHATPSGASASSVSQQDLQAAVRRATDIDAIQPHEPRSLLQLMGFLMRNFRLQVFNFVSLEAHMSDTLRIDVAGQQNVVKTNMLLALSTHILAEPRIPTSEISIHPEQYAFLTRSELEDLIRIQSSGKAANSYFPINLETLARAQELDLDRFLSGTWGLAPQPRTRREVLIETVGRLESVLVKAMRIYLRLDALADIKNIGTWDETKIKAWYQNLPDQDPETEFRSLAQEILQIYFEFEDKLHSPDLVVEAGKPGELELNLYDEMRLFSFALDKAILRLPWGPIGSFTLNVASQSSDFSLGTRASFREYVGTHQLSPFTIATPEFMTDMFATVQANSSENMKAKVDELKARFHKVCEQLMTQRRENL